MALSLDEEQQAIVDYDGSQVVIAGPGSGKTRTLTAKAEKLYAEGKDFICLTYTRAAAAELRERLPEVTASTIHSYCNSFSGGRGGYENMLTGFLAAKERGHLEGEKYAWVLVDEAQDLTANQWSVVKSIVGGKIFAVGDPYQSIYGWNGALGLQIFSDLKSLGCKEFTLKNNYRSSPKIVKLLNEQYSRGLVSKGIKELGTTVILARTRDLVSKVAYQLTSENIGYTVRHSASELTATKEDFHGSSTLRVMTCHCSKGLEFDRVLLYCWSPEPFRGKYPGQEEFNLYYVSKSRASKEFHEVWGPNKLKELVINGK